MDIREWLKNENREERILLTQNLFYGRDLIASSRDSVFGVKGTALSMAAGSIVSYALAEFGMRRRLISRRFGSVLLRKVLLEHTGEMRYYRNPALLDQASADEIYRVLCLLRNSSTEDYMERIEELEAYDRNRIQDLFLIRSLYEEALEKKGVLDPCAVVHMAAEIAENLEEDVLFHAKIAVLKEEEKYFTLDERRLVSALSALCNPEGEVILLELPEYFNDYLEQKKPENVTLSFQRGFGYANEIKNVIYNILKKEHAYGDTEILYADSSMEPWLLSELETAKIPFAFRDGKSVEENAVILEVRALLNWAGNGYRLTDFRNVLRSSLFNRPYVADEKEGIWHASSLMRRMTSGKAYDSEYMVGWGFERYNAYLELMKKDLCAEERKTSERITGQFAVDLLEGILNLFENDGQMNSGVFAQKMLSFVKNMVPSSNLAVLDGFAVLERVQNYMVFADMTMREPEIYAMMDQCISSMIKREEERGDAVVLCSMKNPFILRRKHVYAVGMSASNMSGNTDESPVMNDSEMQVLLKGSYLPLVQNESIRRREELLRSFASLKEGDLIISWPDYDTQEMNLRNPAVLVLDLQSIANTDQSSGFVYGTPSHGASYPVTGMETEERTPASVLLNPSKQYSATSLEALADCPRAWYYDKVCGLKEDEIPEYQADKWLDLRMRGNFIHSVLQYYLEQVSLQKKIAETPDEEILETVIRKVHEETEKSVPEAEDWIVQREIRQMKDACLEYLKTVHKDYRENGWGFVCAELVFRDVHMTAGMEFLLTGRIDRVDCRIDDQAKQIVLRTIDYKTGKPDNVRTKCKHGTALQREIYTAALKDKTVQKTICDILKKRYGKDCSDYEILAKDFFYVFPMTPDDPFLPVLEEDSFSLVRLGAMVEAVKNTGTYPDRFSIGKNLEETLGASAGPGMMKVFDAINGEPKKRGKGRKKSEEKCGYCAFRDMCSAAVLK